MVDMRFRWRRFVEFGAALLFVVVSTGCGHRQALVGLEGECDARDPRTAIANANNCIEQARVAGPGRRRPPKLIVSGNSMDLAEKRALERLGARSPASATALEDSDVRDAIETALLALNNEHEEFHEQFLPRSWAPLQVFPRLTFPAMAEPSVTSEGRRWVFPLILDVGNQSFDRSERAGGDISALYDEALSEVTFWLRPFLDSAAQEPGAVWMELGVRNTLLDIRPELLEAGTKGKSPFDRPDSVTVAFAIAESSELRNRYFRLRVMPRLQLDDDNAAMPSELGDTIAAMKRGDWRHARDALAAAMRDSRDPIQLARDLHKVLKGAKNRFRRLQEQLAALKDCVGHIEGSTSPLHCYDNFLADPPSQPAVYEDHWYERAFYCLAGQPSPDPRDLFDADPAPVWLDGGDRRFSFVVAGDLQFHPSLRSPKSVSSPVNEELVARFFNLLNRPPAPTDDSNVRDSRAAKFVLIAGDLGDGAAASVGMLPFILNSIGLSTPASPYSTGTLCEKPEYPYLHELLRHFDKPVFAVPGNHDGFVGYPGFLNNVVRLMCWGPRLLARFAPFRSFAKCELANDFVPVIAKAKVPDALVPPFLAPMNRPRYDGFAEWTRFFGPLNVAFNFRGQSFVGLNSYNLYQAERAAVGSDAINWGGGVQSHDVKWLGMILHQLGRGADELLTDSADSCRASTRRHQFLFMHHDPRGSVPVPDHYGSRIDRYGEYDTVDNAFSLMSLGHFGLGHSPSFDLFIPIVTPASHLLLRRLDNDVNKREYRFQEEWMMRWQGPQFFAGDDVIIEPYNAGPLIDVVNTNLACRPTGPAGAFYPNGISHVFFAHDDEPLVQPWLQGKKRTIFPPSADSCWKGQRYTSVWRQIGSYAVKLRTDEPEPWATIDNVCVDQPSDKLEDWQAAPMFFPDDPRHARVVRLDDVGQMPSAVGSALNHGFHVISVDSLEGGTFVENPRHVLLNCPIAGQIIDPLSPYPNRCPERDGEPMARPGM